MNIYSTVEDWSTLICGFSLLIFSVSNINNLVRFRAVHNIFGLSKSIFCPMLFAKCSLTSVSLHIIESGLCSWSRVIKLLWVFSSLFAELWIVWAAFASVTYDDRIKKATQWILFQGGNCQRLESQPLSLSSISKRKEASEGNSWKEIEKTWVLS